MNQILKPMRPFRHHPARMIDILGRVPKDIKFEICGCPMMAGLKLVYPGLHDLLGHFERYMGIQGISTRPKIRPDLVPGNFTEASHGLVIITAFQHRQGGPPVHRMRRRHQGASRCNYNKGL
jgi:hypothetical protein